MATRVAFACLLTVALAASRASATANYVYHEQTTMPTGGTCGNYLDTPAPGPSDPYTLRIKIEYETYTDHVEIYYTTDGTMPSGAFGVAGGTSVFVAGAYSCTFTYVGQVIDVATVTIPPQPAGTTVQYIASAWHSPEGAGGPEIFANSGTCRGCGDCEISNCATVFQYTVSGATDAGSDVATTDVPEESSVDAGAVDGEQADGVAPAADSADVLAGEDGSALDVGPVLDAGPDADAGIDVVAADVSHPDAAAGMDATGMDSSTDARDAGPTDATMANDAANEAGPADEPQGLPPPQQSCGCRTAGGENALWPSAVFSTAMLLAGSRARRRRHRARRA